MAAINEHFPSVRTIKGRARHPQSQGMIERGNKPFKDALQDWMQDNESTNWSLGAYIVQRQLNRRASEARGNTTPYESYFGLPSVSEIEMTLGDNAKHVRTEVGLQLIEDVLVYLKKYHPLLLLNDEIVRDIIERGDGLYDEEEKLESQEDVASFNIEEKRQALYATILKEVIADSDDVQDFEPETLDATGGDIGSVNAGGNSSEASSHKNSADDDDADSSADNDQERLRYKESCRVRAVNGQRKQAQRVNASRGAEYKEALDVGDICLIRIEGNTKAATDKVAIVVKVC
jgi:hypothetical protein